MKNSIKGNIYETTLAETRELFAGYLEGAPGSVVCIVSEKVISSTAREALENSVAMLGYGRKSCTYVTLGSQTNGAEETSLDASALFLLLEGLDPLVIVATDKQAALALGEAYRQKVVPDTAKRLFGHDVVTFSSFEHMLESQQDKQAAWALLKKLPKFGEH